MRISVITVNYNDQDGLQRTLESVRKQTCHDFELLVMDGGSTDGSQDVIEQYLDVITYHESAKDGGPFFGMNKGIERVQGDYCIFMNSGDSFYDEHVLEKFVAEPRDKDVYTGVAAEHLGTELYQWNPPYAIDISLKFFYRGALSHQSSFIRTSWLKQHPYDTKYRIVSDWKFFLECLVICHASYEPLPFFVSHYMDGGISRDAVKAFAERDLVLQELFLESQLKDMHRQIAWDKLVKEVDPISKVGKMIVLLTQFMVGIRKKLKNNVGK